MLPSVPQHSVSVAHGPSALDPGEGTIDVGRTRLERRAGELRHRDAAPIRCPVRRSTTCTASPRRRRRADRPTRGVRVERRVLEGDAFGRRAREFLHSPWRSANAARLYAKPAAPCDIPLSGRPKAGLAQVRSPADPTRS